MKIEIEPTNFVVSCAEMSMIAEPGSCVRLWRGKLDGEINVMVITMGIATDVSKLSAEQQEKFAKLNVNLPTPELVPAAEAFQRLFPESAADA